MISLPSPIRILGKAHEEEILSPLAVQSILDIAECCGLSSENDIFLLAALFAEQEAGNISLALKETTLKTHCEQLLLHDQTSIDIHDILERASSGDITLLFSSYKPKELPKVVVLCQHHGQFHLSFKKNHEAGLDIEGRLAQRFRKRDCDNRIKDLPQIFNEIFHARPIQIREQILQLNSEQKHAVALALVKKNLLITGGPGTGKTSVIVSIVRAFSRIGFSPLQVVLAAPTGRAAQRLTEAMKSFMQSIPNPSAEDHAFLELEGQTLHRLLKFSPLHNRFLRNVFNPLDASVVIIDEVSMVDLFLMQSVLQALSDNCHLILVGDRDQLPAVDAGGLLTTWVPMRSRMTLTPGIQNALQIAVNDRSSLIGTDPASRDQLVILNKSYRTRSTILEIAHAIRNGEEEIVNKLEKHSYLETMDLPQQMEDLGDFVWIQPGENPQEDLHHLLRAVADRAYTNYKSISIGRSANENNENHESNDPAPVQCSVRIDRLLESFRILTVVRKSLYGCDWINDFLVGYMRQSDDYSRVGHYFPGMPLMVTRNSYEHKLFNGDVGIVVERNSAQRTGGLVAVFPRGEEVSSYPVTSLPAHQAAYAMTVHKSQGSEYDQVLLVLPHSPEHPLLARQILYTGLSRARRSVILYGSAESLIGAIRKEPGGSSWMSEWNGG